MEMAADETSIVGRMVRAARLDASLYEEVEHDPDATKQALIVVVGTALAAAIGAGITIGLAGLIFFLVIPDLFSSDPRPGDSVELPAGSEATRHTTNVADLVGNPGEPPVGGPHFGGPECVPPRYGPFCGPLPYGIYDHQVADGNAIHSLEHGIVWITYDPELIAGEALQLLEDVANDFRRDVILSPREPSALPIYAVSWGRILRIDGTNGVEVDALRDFIDANRNRSPEPGLRGAGHQ